jgi:hypothetical protein
MWSEMWKAIRVNLKKRLIIGLFVVYSFAIFISFPNIAVKVGALSVFAISASLYIVIFLFQFIPNIKLCFNQKKEHTCFDI